MDVKQTLQAKFPEVSDAFFEKEGSMLFLRVEVSLKTLDDVSKLSREISDFLDQNDPTEKEYYLDIYSSGAESTIAINDLKNYVDQYVSIDLNSKVKDKLNYEGTIIEADEQKILVKWNAKGQFRKQEIELTNIKTAKLAIKF